MIPVIHIHAQSSWHCEATIIGNRAALEILKAAITQALDVGAIESESVFCADGEGYGVLVILRDADLGAPEWDDRHLPYRDKIAGGRNQKGTM